MSDREEGEIVDDDFEDISDNSIIVPSYMGKSESPKENLPAISLSSVSDSDAFERKKKNCQERHSKRKSKCYRKRRCRHERNTIPKSDRDSYLELDPRLQKQLKAAIHIESDVCHKNNLQSRLKAMKKLETSVIDEMIEKSDKDRSDQKASSDEGDDELIQLRLEALRTAVLNKYEHRKKRKREMLQKDDIKISVNTNSLESNKQNTYFVDENQPIKKPCLEGVDETIEITCNTPPDEDEDVLRALLLASMSKKITKAMESTKSKTTIKNNNFVKNHGFKTKNIVWPASVGTQIIVPFKNCIAQKNSLKLHPLQLKNVKPIIINVDDDSDSEDSATKNFLGNSKNKTNEIECTVERFLKEQRARIEAQFESPLPKLIKSTNGNKPVVLKKPIISSEILEKSSVKLLPKVKQLEYHKLLQKLKNAENKPRLGRMSPIVDTERDSNKNLSKKVSAKRIPASKTTATKAEKSPDVKSDARALHIALKQMQIQKNGRLPKSNQKEWLVAIGWDPTTPACKNVVWSDHFRKEDFFENHKHRILKPGVTPSEKLSSRPIELGPPLSFQKTLTVLQIEEKYVILTPIIKKINEATTERKKYDQEVKRLLEELKEAKNKLHLTHLNFSSYVKELIAKKEEIEKGILHSSLEVVVEPKKKLKHLSTLPSTPKEEIAPLTSKISLIHSAATSSISSTMGEKPRFEETLNKVADDRISSEDPRDIPIVNSVIPKYISPLDYVNRKDPFDPLAITCPYDIDGNCRDPECSYKHYSKRK